MELLELPFLKSDYAVDKKKFYFCHNEARDVWTKTNKKEFTPKELQK
jgi:hypothetical protein